MIEASFIPNIHYVTRTIQTTKDLVDSIENDLKDVRSLIHSNVSQTEDQKELILLLQVENEQFKVKPGFVCLNFSYFSSFPLFSLSSSLFLSVT